MSLKKLTSTYPIVPEDFDLSLKIRMTEAFAKMGDELLASAKSMSAFGGSMPRITPRMMAHPVSPWPFGTVLRPNHPSLAQDGRIMWIGNDTAISLNSATHAGEVLPFPRSDQGYWEPVPESEP